MTAVFTTATTANGFLADPHDSLDWLFEVEGDGPDMTSFTEKVSVYVLGSTTYEWLLRQEHLLDHPEKWSEYFTDRPMFVFTSRDLPVPAGADVRLVSGPVERHLVAIRDAGGDGVVWVQGGGDLAGQFLDAGALDRITLTVAPAFLAAGRPLLPRDVRSDRLRLETVEQVGQFAVLDYAVVHQE